MEMVRVHPQNDADRVRSFLARSDPDDYLLEGLDEWVREGRLWALVDRGEWLGFGRLHDLGDGEGWASGFRVMAGRRGQGLGSELLRGILEDARAVGIHAVRAVIEDGNLASRRLFERCGFASVAELALRCGRPRSGSAHPLRLAAPGASLDGPVGWVAQNTGRVDLVPGNDGGRFGRWRPTLVARWAREGKLYMGSGLAIAVQEDWWAHPRTLWVNPLQGELEALVAALDALTAERSHDEWQAFLPSSETLRAEYEHAGLVPHPFWGDRVRLYERFDDRSGGPNSEA